jgi:hypothetical protein
MNPINTVTILEQRYDGVIFEIARDEAKAHVDHVSDLRQSRRLEIA